MPVAASLICVVAQRSTTGFPETSRLQCEIRFKRAHYCQGVSCDANRFNSNRILTSANKIDGIILTLHSRINHRSMSSIIQTDGGQSIGLPVRPRPRSACGSHMQLMQWWGQHVSINIKHFKASQFGIRCSDCSTNKLIFWLVAHFTTELPLLILLLRLVVMFALWQIELFCHKDKIL